MDDFVMVKSRSSKPVVTKGEDYNGIFEQYTEEYQSQNLDNLVDSFYPGTLGIAEIPVKPDEVIPTNLIQQLILNREGDSQASREVISGMLLSISSGLSDIFLHPQLQYILDSKLPIVVADKAKNDPRMIAASFDLVAQSLINPVGDLVEWLNEGRLREYHKRLKASDISAELRQNLISLGETYWKDSYEPSQFVGEFVRLIEGATEAQRIDLGRIMLLLAGSTSVDSTAAWGELLTAIGQGFVAIATLIKRQLTNELKYASLSNQVRGTIGEAVSIERPFIYKADAVGHQLEALKDLITNDLRCTLQKTRTREVIQTHGGLTDQHVQQILPVLTTAAIQSGQGVQLLLERLIATIARQNCASVTQELLDIIQQHCNLYINVRGQQSEQNFIDRFRNEGRLLKYGLHRNIESGDETEFWNQILAKMAKIFGSENTLGLLLKLVTPEVESQMKAMRRTDSLPIFGASAAINQFVAEKISKWVAYYSDPFVLNQQLIKKIDLYWTQMHNYEKDAGWMEYQRQLAFLNGDVSADATYQASKFAVNSFLNHWLLKVNLPPIPGLKNLIAATALEIHGACQIPAVTRSLLFHLVEQIAEQATRHPLSQEQIRELLNKPLQSYEENKFLSTQNVDQFIAIALGLLESGRQHLPEDTSILGKGLLWMGATLAGNLSEWIKNLLLKRAHKVLDYSAASLIAKVIGSIQEALEHPDIGLKATLDKI